MPAQHRLRAHDDQRVRPGMPLAGQEDQEPPVDGGQPGALDGADEDDELVAQ